MFEKKVGQAGKKTKMNLPQFTSFSHHRPKMHYRTLLFWTSIAALMSIGWILFSLIQLHRYSYGGLFVMVLTLSMIHLMLRQPKE